MRLLGTSELDFKPLRVLEIMDLIVTGSTQQVTLVNLLLSFREVEAV
jgi:hypothetical protein